MAGNLNEVKSSSLTKQFFVFCCVFVFFTLPGIHDTDPPIMFSFVEKFTPGLTHKDDQQIGNLARLQSGNDSHKSHNINVSNCGIVKMSWRHLLTVSHRLRYRFRHNLVQEGQSFLLFGSQHFCSYLWIFREFKELIDQIVYTLYLATTRNEITNTMSNYPIIEVVHSRTHMNWLMRSVVWLSNYAAVLH